MSCTCVSSKYSTINVIKWHQSEHNSLYYYLPVHVFIFSTRRCTNFQTQNQGYNNCSCMTLYEINYVNHKSFADLVKFVRTFQTNFSHHKESK